MQIEISISKMHEIRSELYSKNAQNSKIQHKPHKNKNRLNLKAI